MHKLIRNFYDQSDPRLHTGSCLYINLAQGSQERNAVGITVGNLAGHRQCSFSNVGVNRHRAQCRTHFQQPCVEDSNFNLMAGGVGQHFMQYGNAQDPVIGKQPEAVYVRGHALKHEQGFAVRSRDAKIQSNAMFRGDTSSFGDQALVSLTQYGADSAKFRISLFPRFDLQRQRGCGRHTFNRYSRPVDSANIEYLAENYRNCRSIDRFASGLQSNCDDNLYPGFFDAGENALGIKALVGQVVQKKVVVLLANCVGNILERRYPVAEYYRDRLNDGYRRYRLLRFDPDRTDRPDRRRRPLAPGRRPLAARLPLRHRPVALAFPSATMLTR